MKRRLSAILLALGMSLSVFSMGAYAEETETEAAAEQATEAVTEAEEAEETAGEAEVETEMSAEDQTKMTVSMYLQLFESFSDDQLDLLADGSYEDHLDQFDTTQQMYIAYYMADSVNWEATASNYLLVKNDLGALVEVLSYEESQDKENYYLTADVKYEKTGDKSPVTAQLIMDIETSVLKINWDIDYPMSELLKQAALNTIMGLCIVFAALAFLAFLISKLHIIPDMIEAKAKKNAPAAAPQAAPAPAAAPVVEEEEYVDDLELVAVITAAIAASENTSSDGFVVRSIKKANKRNWQRA